MSKTHQILIAGFGGQGVLFAGKIIAYCGMTDGNEVTWLPSYGPEMRGGTANCNVIISDTLIGSPIVDAPSALLCLNGPSFDKFEKNVIKGGKIIVDSTLVKRKSTRDDIEFYQIAATQLSIDHKLKNMSNMIMLGKLLKETQFTTFENFKEAVVKSIPTAKKKQLEVNLKAIELGYNN